MIKSNFLLLSFLTICFISCKTSKPIVTDQQKEDTVHVFTRTEQKHHLVEIIEEIEDEDIKDIPLDEKIGQMVMIGVAGNQPLNSNDRLSRDVRSGKVGGIILFEKNISPVNSEQTLKELIKGLQDKSSVPLLVSIDEEGGRVNRLKQKYGFPKTVSAAYLGSLASTDSTYFYANQTASTLANLGININFAPVLDLAVNAENPVIAKAQRSYSASSRGVVLHASKVIQAHHNNNVLTALKHFPGHGSSTTDSHFDMTDVSRTWTFDELLPYKKLIDTGFVDAVMTAHIINSHMDTSSIPSTLSKKVVTDILRDFLGYKGVVFSDDMQMHAISKHFGLENAVKMAIDAGVDILLFGNNVNESDKRTATEIHSIIEKHVESGEISEERINQSFQRIMKLKARIVEKQD